MKAIRSLLIIKEKWGPEKEVKTILLADGRGQCGQFTKQETTSPTVARESVIISAVIDAHERRHVGTYDIPGAFLTADCDVDDDEVIMILKGRLAEMMIQVSPSLYRKYITNHSGRQRNTRAVSTNGEGNVRYSEERTAVLQTTSGRLDKEQIYTESL